MQILLVDNEKIRIGDIDIAKEIKIRSIQHYRKPKTKKKQKNRFYENEEDKPYEIAEKKRNRL